MAPAVCSDLLACCARSFKPRLHGVIVLYALAMPTIGLSKSASPNPTARNIDRFGARSSPCVMVLLLRRVMRFQCEVLGGTLHRKKLKLHARLFPRNATSGDNGSRAPRWRQNTRVGWRWFVA